MSNASAGDPRQRKQSQIVSAARDANGVLLSVCVIVESVQSGNGVNYSQVMWFTL
jgi:hypothetical protein